MNQIAVIGLGRFGTAICEEAFSSGCEILAIDKDEQRTQEIMQNKLATHSVQIDATNKNALVSVGITDFDSVVVSMAGSIQNSILTTLLLKELGVKNIIAKASSAAHGVVLEKIGATQVVFPEKEMGKRIAKTLVTGAADVICLTSDFSIYEVDVPEKFIGKSLVDLKLRQKQHLNVVAIRRNNENITDIDPEEIIQENDCLILIGKEESIKKLAK